jgi:hypothetical protein
LANSNCRKRFALKPKLDPERSFWDFFLFEEINALKRQLNTEKTANSKKMKAEFLLLSLY